jgi:ribulose-phosphate 3-epimerase
VTETTSRVRLSASVSSIDPLDYRRDLRGLDKAGIDGFHFDLCDGHFAPTIQLSPAVVRSARRLTDKRLDVHLYCTHPSRYIQELADCGADCLIVQVESAEDYREVVRRVSDRGLAAGVGILPWTTVPESLVEVIGEVAFVVANTVGPAYPGQPYDARGLETARSVRALARKLHPGLEIAIDGSVSLERLPQMLAAGARHLVCGTGCVFRPGRLPAQWLKDFRRQAAPLFEATLSYEA